MECLLWEFLSNTSCTDIINLHALLLEVIAGIIIAFTVLSLQLKKKANRRNELKLKLAQALIPLRKNIKELINAIEDPEGYRNPNWEQVDLGWKNQKDWKIVLYLIA